MPFSVLMSLYWKERPEFLCQSLESVFDQTLVPDEVVMVEDGPVGEVLEAVVNEFSAKHPEMKVVRLPRNGGLGPALNEGLKHCSHELVARMDTDDIALPQRFERQVGFMESHKDIDLCSAWIEEFINDNPDEITSIRKLPETPEKLYEYGKRRCPVNHPVAMFRKRAVEKAGSYQPLYLFEDYYLWARMLVGGAKMYNIQESLLRFRTSADMYNRRGGLKYALAERSLLWKFYKLGYVGLFSTLKNMTMRFTVRVMPNRLRSFVYTHLLR